MTLRMTGRLAITGLALTAALGLTACGSDDPKDPPTTPRTTTSAKAKTNLPPTPSAAELNAQFLRVLDPAVPNTEKLDMIQGVQADPELPNRLADAYKQTGATIQVTEVVPFGDTLNAKATIDINGQQNIADVPFVAEDGKWKVQKAWVCAGLTNFNMTSPACTP